MKYKIILQIFHERCLWLSVILLFIFSACNDKVLVEHPRDFLTPANAYTTFNGVQQGETGLYSAVRNWFCSDAWWSGDDMSCIYAPFALGNDESFDGEEPGGQRFLTDYSNTLVAGNREVKNMWTWNYTNIQQCNVLIDAINVADNKIWPTDKAKNVALSEAMVFRAFHYRTLVSFFGDVPLVTEVVNTAKTDFVRAPKADVYKQIEDDLIFATLNLPSRGEAAAPGKLTKGAAWHYLSEIYLAQNKFQLAKDAASHVINDYGYALMTQRFGTKLSHDIFGSGDVFYDLFSGGNQNLPENTEAVWVIQNEPLVTGGGYIYAESTFGPRYFSLAKTPDGLKPFRGEFVDGVYTGYSDTLGRGVAQCRATDYMVYKIWAGNWNNDIRNAEHNIKRNFYYDQPASIYNKQKVDFSLYPNESAATLLKDTINYIFPQWMKFSDIKDHVSKLARSGGGYSYKDWYAIRLSETYLLRAEANLGLGKKDLAAADINVVRNRAHAIPVTPDQVTIEYILDERARELYGEEQRGITLMRLGLMVSRTRQYNSNPLRWGANIADHNNLWPIPQSEIDLNINAVLTQNPGY